MSDEPTNIVTVKGISNRGKQLVKQFGNRWNCWRIKAHLSCFNGKKGVLISPEGHVQHCIDARWVRVTDWLIWTDANLALVVNPPVIERQDPNLASPDRL